MKEKEYLGYGVSARSDDITGLIWLTNEGAVITLDHPSAKALLKYLTKELEKRDIG